MLHAGSFPDLSTYQGVCERVGHRQIWSTGFLLFGVMLYVRRSATSGDASLSDLDVQAEEEADSGRDRHDPDEPQLAVLQADVPRPVEEVHLLLLVRG